MTRELIIQNIMNNYKQYGITQDMVGGEGIWYVGCGNGENCYKF